MPSLNRATIMGHLGRDPEMRYMPNGDAVVNISIATTRKWKDKQGELQEETEWHNVSAFGRTAEVIGKYCKKGSPLYIDGRLRTRKWQDKDGNDRYTTEIVAENIQLLGGRQDSDSRRPQAREDRDSPPAAHKRSRPEGPKRQTGFNDIDDDIPF